MDRLEGSVFAGYLIERKLGSGGMAVVYRARHPRLPRPEALKILNETHSDDKDFQARFLREAELASQLDHPNLVSVHDRGIHHGQLWIAMQYIDGTDAAALIKQGPGVLPPERVISIVSEAARGLDEIHHAGLVHRDVKPHNIMVTRGRDGYDRVLVTDFGIARSFHDTEGLTASGAMIGTLAYVAPEQLENLPVDHRADVYALGCTLFQMLTGLLPFQHTDPGSMVRAHLMTPPPRPSLAGLGLPATLDPVIARALAKDPGQRYPSCGALAADAAAALYRPAPPVPPRRTGRKRLTLGILGGAAILALLATVGVVALRDQGRPSNPVATPSATKVSTTTTSTADSYPAWKTYAYVVAAFPTLLPNRPNIIDIGGSGNCFPVDANENSIDVAVPAGPTAEIFCAGAAPPADTMTFTCRADRTPMTIALQSDATGEGSQEWTRASGSGHLIWGHGEIRPGQVRGMLQVFFDSPARYFCSVTVSGGATGAELLQRWWPTAPL